MMPRVDPVVLGVLLLLGSIAGLAYVFWTGVHRNWRENKLGWDDFIWYATLPLLGYIVMLAAAIGIWMRGAFGPYALAAAVMLLMVVGIRNAWDLVIWFAQKRAGVT